MTFKEWYEKEIGSENKPEYEAAKWAWEYQQKKLDCCREENKAHLEKIDELQGRIDEAVDYVSESAGVNLTSEIALNDILEGNKDEN